MWNHLSPKQKQWRKLWPSGFIALIATVQLLLTFAIIGLEGTSLAFDVYHSMIFAGFYCSLFFMITWISMFTVTCCNRHSFGCATHVVVENTLSIIAASVLLYFDSVFLNNPFTCYYGSSCYSTYSGSSYYSSSIYNSNNYSVKLSCIKAQIACAALMLTTNVIYIIIYIIVVIKTKDLSNEVEPMRYGGTPSYVIPQSKMHQQPPPFTFGSSLPLQSQLSQRLIECHNCHALIRIN